MLESLIELDTELFRWINSHHCSTMDWVMWTMSQHWLWFIVILAAYCFTALRYDIHKWWLVIAGLAICFLLADQGSVLIKNIVCRPRPCHALEEVRMFKTHCGGEYGFVSSHAANAFAIATYLWIRYRKQCKICTILMILWALATSYSRAYLGKHYPGDLLCGALFGIAIGVVVTVISTMIEKKCTKIETK